MRAFQLSLIALAVAAALAISVLLVIRSLPTETSQQAAREEVTLQEETASADIPAPEDTTSKEDTIVAAFAPPPQAPAQPTEPFIARPAGTQRSPYEPLILPPSGLSGGDIKAVSRGPETMPRDKGGTSPTAARINLSPAQEERIRYVLQSHTIVQSEVVDLQLRPGNTMPKEIPLSPLPIELVSVVPDYRSYSYVFMQDRIVIVATNSREIGLILPF